MGVRLRDVLMGQLDALGYEPTDKRIRARIGEATVIDTSRAMLVWEPRRVVPTYAVPREDIAAELVAAAASEPVDAEAAGVAPMGAPRLAGRTVLDASVPFAVRTTPGQPLAIRVAGAERDAAAFRPADPALEGYLIVDFDAFDAWYEEDERNLGHPRDPFHRVDIVHSSRHVRVERDGDVLAGTTAAELTDRLAFFNESVDLVVDGTPLPRPVTPWSRR